MHLTQEMIDRYFQVMAEIRPQKMETPECDHRFVKVERGPFPNSVMELGDYGRVHFRRQKPDRTEEVRKVFRYMMGRLSIPLNNIDYLISIYDKHQSLRFHMRNLCVGIIYHWIQDTVHKVSLSVSKKCKGHEGDDC